MKVYLISAGYAWEGSETKAILSSREEAEFYKEKYEDRIFFNYNSVKIEEWEVGEVLDKRWEEVKELRDQNYE